MNKGFIAINKPQGWTSFDVVNKLKYKLKPLKVGHLGTLDPMATGVLIVSVGKATKLFDIMQTKKKTYVATFEFGYETDTLDAMGKETATCNYVPSLDEINSVLPEFIGKIDQIPPKYSAKSINGKRAYDLARNNIDFELKPKQIEIFNIKILSYQENKLSLEIECGSGTYIRSIGRDIAAKLNSLATMTELVRTKIDNITINQCFEIKNIDNVKDIIMPIKNMLRYNVLTVSEIIKSKLLNGQTVEISMPNGTYAVENETDTLALIDIEENRAKMSLFLG